LTIVVSESIIAELLKGCISKKRTSYSVDR